MDFQRERVADNRYDALVIGSGPNGLSAAIRLAQFGLSVCVFESEQDIGGSAKTAALTLPGFQHDICSAIHPMARISPFFRSLPLEKYGLQWIDPPLALAHPFDAEPGAFLSKSIDATAESLGADATHYKNWLAPLEKKGNRLIEEILGPMRFPHHPVLMARFGMNAIRSAASLAKSKFANHRTRALFAGCAAHSIVALDKPGTSAFGMVLTLAAHMGGWPIIKSGSQKIIEALAQHLKSLGGEIRTGERITSLKSLPAAKAIVFALTPNQISRIAADEAPRFSKKAKGFQYGPGVFKMDWALDGPIPWKDPLCLQAGTVHVGATFEEILASEAAAWRGRISERPFVLVGQQSLFDSTRAPSGKHTGWAYCHVPNRSTVDMTDLIEKQIERFAPGFRDRILARGSRNPLQLEQHNQNLVGGDISGGANNLWQVLARPMLKWDPYATDNPKIFICSSSTPPGGGVHGMCGYHAANSVLRKVFRKSF